MQGDTNAWDPQACHLMTEYQKARDFLVRAQREQPFNHDINSELLKLAR